MKENQQTNEQWRQVQGYPCYYVSDRGQVMSLRNPKKPKILRQGKGKGGYLHVILTSGDKYGNGEKKNFRVNRLVALAFIKNEHPDKRRDVGHWDSNPANNSAENLYWCTPKENANNPITLQRNRDARPEAVKKTSKAIYVYDEELNQVSAFTSTASASRELNTSQGNIASCCTGALPRYMGRIWSYVQLNDISERQQLEKKQEQQRKKNRASVAKAVQKYYKRQKEENTEVYQRVLTRAREYGRKYYQEHTEEILEKARQRRDERRSDRIQA